MQFKEGDKVKFIDEAGSATVIEQNDKGVLVETDEGFEILYQANELIPSRALKVGHTERKGVFTRRPSGPKVAPKSEYLEQDLHIHALVDFTGGMTNFDMLRKQLWTAKNTIEKAKKGGIKKVIFIHGVGEGILRQELYKLLDAHGDLTYYDADMARYGKGATEVILR
jgi:dsDNA-specific endonuclease/ATPase MutS2